MKFSEQIIVSLERCLPQLPRISRALLKVLYDCLPSAQKRDLSLNDDVLVEIVFLRWIFPLLTADSKLFGDAKLSDASKQALTWICQILKAQAKNTFLDNPQLSSLNEDLGKYRVIMMQYVRKIIVHHHSMFYQVGHFSAWNVFGKQRHVSTICWRR